MIEYCETLHANWIELLQSKLYKSESCSRLCFCSLCASKLKSGKVSQYALCRGWDYLQKTPTEIKSLNKY